MSTVSDLSAHEAATTASEIWKHRGERKAGQQLLHYALTKDENCPKALLVLADMLETLAGREVAVVVIEYIYARVDDAAIRSRMTLIRRIGLNRLGLLSHPSPNMSDLPIEDWQDSPEFIVDEQGTANVTKELLGISPTPRQAFEAACLLLGVHAGLMVPRTSKSIPTFDDCFYPDNFRKSDDYSSFLAAEKLTAEF
jgi:hypothetical protein